MEILMVILLGVLNPFLGIMDLIFHYSKYDNPFMNWFMIIGGIATWYVVYMYKTDQKEQGQVRQVKAAEEREEELKKIIGLEYKDLLNIQEILDNKPATQPIARQINATDREDHIFLNNEEDMNAKIFDMYGEKEYK